MVLPKTGRSSGADANGYYGRENSVGAPARDVSWHPHYPVLASTSFDQSVKIWTLQNDKESMQMDISESNDASKSMKISEGDSTEKEYGQEDEDGGEDEQDDDDDEVINIGGGGRQQITMR